VRDSRGVCVWPIIAPMNAITQYLSDDERPFWLFPFGEIVASSGVRLHLDADKDAPEEGKLTRATALQSLRDWVAHYRPPMLREHERDGRAHGEIVRVIEVTQAQAAEWGVEQRGDAVWGVARLRGQMLADYDDGLLRTTSPHLAMSYTDDEGTVWPLAMLELSAVDLVGYGYRSRRPVSPSPYQTRKTWVKNTRHDLLHARASWPKSTSPWAR